MHVPRGHHAVQGAPSAMRSNSHAQLVATPQLVIAPVSERWRCGVPHLIMAPLPRALQLPQPLPPRRVTRTDHRPQAPVSSADQRTTQQKVKPAVNQQLEAEVRAQQQELKRLREIAAKEKEQLNKSAEERKQREAHLQRHTSQTSSAASPARNSSGYGAFTTPASRQPSKPRQSRSFEQEERGQQGFSVAPTNKRGAPPSVARNHESSNTTPFSSSISRTTSARLPVRPQVKAHEDITISIKSSDDLWTKLWRDKSKAEKTKKKNKKEDRAKEREKSKAEKRGKKDEVDGEAKVGMEAAQNVPQGSAASVPALPLESSSPEDISPSPPSHSPSSAPPPSPSAPDQRGESGSSEATSAPPGQARPNFFAQNQSKNIILSNDEVRKADKAKSRTSIFMITKKDKSPKSLVSVAPRSNGLGLDTKPYLSVWAPGSDALSGPHIHKLKKKETVIGTDKACQVCVEDVAMSKRQALISLEDGVFVARDLDVSVGCTRVNGQTIPASGCTVLRAGDVLAMGKTKIVVCNDRVDKPSRFLPEDRAALVRAASTACSSTTASESREDSIAESSDDECPEQNEEDWTDNEPVDEGEEPGDEQGNEDEKCRTDEEYGEDGEVSDTYGYVEEETWTYAGADETPGHLRVAETELSSLAATLQSLTTGVPTS